MYLIIFKLACSVVTFTCFIYLFKNIVEVITWPIPRESYLARLSVVSFLFVKVLFFSLDKHNGINIDLVCNIMLSFVISVAMLRLAEVVDQHITDRIIRHHIARRRNNIDEF